MKHLQPKQFKVSILVEVENEAGDEAKDSARKTIEDLDLKVIGVSKITSLRTEVQDRALHKWFDLMSQEFNEKGLDVREVVRKDFQIPWTPLMVKEILWKKLQKTLTGQTSTKKLDRSKHINLIYDTINRALIERYNGNVNVPPFPSRESYENSTLQQ